MNETLDGILSETLLDQLASDLGVDPDDMRKHPFFRVLKGRILLTYPLRVYDDADVLAAVEAGRVRGFYISTPVMPDAEYHPPEGTVVHLAYLSGSDATDLEMLYGGFVIETAVAQIIKGPIYCTATEPRFKNTNVAMMSLMILGVTVGIAP